jgi:hypothetical protein
MARSHALTAALVVSILFHLSMVSVFSIVIRFPSQGIRYLPLEIVQQVAEKLAHAEPRDVLHAPSPTDFLEEHGPEALAAGMAAEPWDTLPPVELPRLELTVSDPLRTREQSLRIRSQFSELFEPRPPEVPDSWALFTRELRGIGPTLSRTFTGEPEKEKPLQKVSTPVPGIGMYIEWMGEPRQRKVLLAPPIQALLSIDPGQLAEPIAIVFTVNAQGKVTNVRASAVGENAAAVEGVREAVQGYLFEPIETGQTQDQRGTLLIKAETSEP